MVGDRIARHGQSAAARVTTTMPLRGGRDGKAQPLCERVAAPTGPRRRLPAHGDCHAADARTRLKALPTRAGENRTPQWANGYDAGHVAILPAGEAVGGVVYVNVADNSINTKTRYNAPLHYHLRGHRHGTNPLFLRTRARCSGVDIPHALVAVAERLPCPSPADRTIQATPTQAMQSPQTVCRTNLEAVLRPV